MYLCFITRLRSSVWVSCAAFFTRAYGILYIFQSPISASLFIHLHSSTLSRKAHSRQSALPKVEKFQWYLHHHMRPSCCKPPHQQIIFFRNVHLLFLYFCMSNENFFVLEIHYCLLLCSFALALSEIAFADMWRVQFADVGMAAKGGLVVNRWHLHA